MSAKRVHFVELFADNLLRPLPLVRPSRREDAAAKDRRINNCRVLQRSPHTPCAEQRHTACGPLKREAKRFGSLVLFLFRGSNPEGSQRLAGGKRSATTGGEMWYGKPNPEGSQRIGLRPLRGRKRDAASQPRMRCAIRG